MSILALDLGTKTGWAVLRVDGKVESGTVNFSLKKNEGQGQRYVKFRHWLVEIKNTHDLTHIYYEVVMGHGAFAVIAAHVFGGMLATMQAFGEHHQIPYEGFGVSTIKKRFAGHGKATKGDMIAQCRALGFTPADDNEADAIALLHVATDRCPILTPSGASPKVRKRKVVEVPAGAVPF